MTNIINFKVPGDKDPEKPNHPPLINLPLVTKILLIMMILIHAVLYLVLLPPDRFMIFLTFGFVPSLWTGQNIYSLDIFTIISPLTYIFIHGNLMHIGMNSAMLMAFGTGVEKWMGSKRFLLFFLACGVLAPVPELFISSGSQNPVIGASGALSGLFAAILILFQSEGRLPTGKWGIWPFAIFWIGISVIFGLVGGGLAGAPIAWASHLGGFLAGLGLMRLQYFKA